MMNKKATIMPLEKVILLLLAIAAVVLIIIFSRSKIRELTNFFIDFIKQIFK